MKQTSPHQSAQDCGIASSRPKANKPNCSIIDDDAILPQTRFGLRTKAIMPVIPTGKRLTLEFDYLQIRHICCEACHKDFFYLHEGSHKIENSGGLLSNAEKLRKGIWEEFDDYSQAQSRTPRRGKALCPHCKHLQGWMRDNEHSSNNGCFFGAIAVFALGISFLFGHWEIAGVILVCAVIFAAIKSEYIHRELGNYTHPLDYSATPDDFVQLIEESAAIEDRPEYVWNRSLANYSVATKHLIPILPYSEQGLRTIAGY